MGAEKHETGEALRPVIRISVRNLVEFLLRSGDIEEGSGTGGQVEAMQEGSRIHRKIQAQNRKKHPLSYQSEVALSETFHYAEYDFVVEGRADGVDDVGPDMADSGGEAGDGEAGEGREKAGEGNQGHLPLVEEIKGVYRDVKKLEEPELLHLAQARVYAAMLVEQRALEKISVQLTYVNLDTEEVRIFRQTEGKEQLREWFLGLAADYRRWSDFSFYARKERDASIRTLEFPYPYREGQFELAAGVYRSIWHGKPLFLQAPTGSGKTLSTLFPAVKALGEGLVGRVFYLTSKTVTRATAKDTFALFAQGGYLGRTVVITARDRICPLVQEGGQRRCNPNDCPRAEGHYDRINEVLYHCLKGSCGEACSGPIRIFDGSDVSEAAERARVCPYELSLDLALWCDHIICDLNYVFDPVVYLRRFFPERGSGGQGDASKLAGMGGQRDASKLAGSGGQEDASKQTGGGGKKAGAKSEKNLILVDEAHNLVDRGRDMYSAVLYQEEFQHAKRYFPPSYAGIRKHLSAVSRVFGAYRKQASAGAAGEETERSGGWTAFCVLPGVDKLVPPLLRLSSALSEWFEKRLVLPEQDKIRELYFNLRFFLMISEELGEDYAVYAMEDEAGRFFVKLFCLDPGRQISQRLRRCRGAVFFSATMIPMSYYTSLLCKVQEPYAMRASSCFDTKKRIILLGGGVSTLYKRRSPEEFSMYASYCEKIVRAKQGNYMVFFPSYGLLERIGSLIQERLDGEAEFVVQHGEMGLSERDAFLAEFGRPRVQSLVGLCVLGGSFSEGIDLLGERLIGVIIAGLGLPQVSPERQLLKEHFDGEPGGLDGFAVSYAIPGMNRVLQAAGRVIRSAGDVGVIACLDDRFSYPSYQKYFPVEWRDAKRCSINTIEQELRKFWQGLEDVV